MTTKKEKRAQVAARRAAYDAETRRMGLEAQRIDREKREQAAFEKLRAKNSRKNAEAMKAIAVDPRDYEQEPGDVIENQDDIDISRDPMMVNE